MMNILVFGILLFVAISLVVWFLGALISLWGETGTFFGTIKEGQVKTVMCGGIATKFFGRIKGHKVNEETGEITEDPTPQQIGPLEEMFGVRWIGFYPWNTIYHYRFRWNKWAKPTGKADYEIVPKDEIVDSIYFRAPYALVIKDLETSDRLGVTAEVLFTVKIINARTALFLTSDWLASTSAQVTAAVRDFFGQRDYNGLLRLQNEINSKSVVGAVAEFVIAIKSLNDSGFGNDALPNKLGVCIDDSSLLSIEIGEPKGELAQATQKKYVAEREAEEKLIKAEAEANRIRKEAKARAEEIDLIGKAEADSLEKAFKAVDKNGEVLVGLKAAEAVEKTRVNTLALGQGFVLGLTDQGGKPAKTREEG